MPMIIVLIRIYNGTRCLVLISLEKYNAIYIRIRYFISLKSGIIYVFSPNYAKIKLILMTLHNVVILIKSFINKDKNHFCDNIFLEKCSYQLAKK